MSLHSALEKLYATYNKRSLIDPDPLAVVWRYRSPLDKELVGLVAASLAYGQVRQIVRSVEGAVDPLGRSPSAALADSTRAVLLGYYGGFKHRWSTGEELVDLLMSIRRIQREYGSLRACFVHGYDKRDGNVLPALACFVRELFTGSALSQSSLLSEPGRGSACKRLLLYLKWMIRHDDVDPGCWSKDVSAAKLLVPVDTHMHRMGLAFGMTGRKQADMRTALEITEGFRKIEPRDPVKYDFVLTRVGMRDDMDEALVPLGSYKHIRARAV